MKLSNKKLIILAFAIFGLSATAASAQSAVRSGKHKITVNAKIELPPSAQVQPVKRTAPAPRIPSVLDVVYVNGATGNDANDGDVEATAVKTITKAYSLVNNGGTIIVCGETTFDANIYDAKDVTFTSINSAKLKKNKVYTIFQGKTTFRDITLYNVYSNYHMVAGGHTLTFDTGFVLEEEDYIYGSGMQIFGGGLLGSPSTTFQGMPLPATADMNIAEGSDIVVKAGEFGAISAGPVGYGFGDAANTVTVDPAPQGTYKISVSGAVQVRDIYMGGYWEMSGIPTVTLPNAEVTVNNSSAQIGNIWGGGYWIAPVVDPVAITQKNVTVNIQQGTVGSIFAGGLGGMLANGSHTIDSVTVNITGGTIGEIYAGGFMGGSGGGNYTASEVVNNVKIVTDVDISATDIYAGGDGANLYFGDLLDTETIETGTLEVVLSGAAAACGDIIDPALSNVTPASKKIITLDNGTFNIPDAGYGELHLTNGGKGVFDTNISFDKLHSDGNAGNEIIFKQNTGVYPKMSLGTAGIVTDGSPVLIDFIDETDTNAAPAEGQTIFLFSGGTLNAAVVQLNQSNSHNSLLEIEEKNNTFVIKTAAQDISAATVQIAGTYIYNGSAQTPDPASVTVTLAGFGTLIYGADYTYAVTGGGTDAGTATVKVTGQGGFSGTATGTFEILPNIKNGIVISGDTTGMPVGGQFVFTFPEKMDTATARTVTLRNSWDGTTAELTGYFLNDSVTFVVDYRRLDFRTSYTLALSGFYDKAKVYIYEETFTFVTQNYPPAPAIARYITLPALSGVVMQPAAGSHRIQSGSDFVFTLTPPAGTVPHVTTDRILGGAPETLKGTQNADGSYTFVIRDVRENITVSITFATGNEAVGAASLKVWPSPVPRGGTARLEYGAPDNTEVRIYTVQGTLVSIQQLQNGQAMLTFPPVAGVYVVRVAGKTVKAIVN